MAAHIIGHVAYFPEGQLSKLPSRLSSYFAPDDEYPTPYLANRQVKTIYLKILSKMTKIILDKLQSILRSSTSNPKWMGAFMCMLGMALACEEVQGTTEQIGSEDRYLSFGCNPQSGRSANETIDHTYQMMCSLFHMKYKSFTPLKMNERELEKAINTIGDGAIPTIKQIRDLCGEKCRHHFTLLL